MSEENQKLVEFLDEITERNSWERISDEEKEKINKILSIIIGKRYNPKKLLPFGVSTIIGFYKDTKDIWSQGFLKEVTKIMYYGVTKQNHLLNHIEEKITDITKYAAVPAQSLVFHKNTDEIKKYVVSHEDVIFESESGIRNQLEGLLNEYSVGTLQSMKSEIQYCLACLSLGFFIGVQAMIFKVSNDDQLDNLTNVLDGHIPPSEIEYKSNYVYGQDILPIPTLIIHGNNYAIAKDSVGEPLLRKYSVIDEVIIPETKIPAKVVYEGEKND